MSVAGCLAVVSAQSLSRTNKSTSEANRPWVDCSLDISTAASVVHHWYLTVQRPLQRWKTTA